jgi:hypothetical protein
MPNPLKYLLGPVGAQMAGGYGNGNSAPQANYQQQPGGMPMYADSPQFTQQPKHSFWTGSEGGFYNTPIFEQGQAATLNNNLSLGNQLVTDPFNSPIGQQLISQYNKQTIPMLSERFNSMGLGRSSAFNNALRSSGGDLNRNLLQTGLGFQQSGLTPRYQTSHLPNQPGFLQSSANYMTELLVDILGAYLTGGASIPSSIRKKGDISAGQQPQGQPQLAGMNTMMGGQQQAASSLGIPFTNNGQLGGEAGINAALRRFFQTQQGQNIMQTLAKGG